LNDFEKRNFQLPRMDEEDSLNLYIEAVEKCPQKL